MAKNTVWMSKGRFDDDDATCSWAYEGRAAQGFAVPPPKSLLIVFDQDKQPVELWRVGEVTQIDPVYEDGWTWFAESSMAELVATSEPSGISGIAFHDLAFLVLPPDGGWMGQPIELDDAQIADFFDYLLWPDHLREE